MSFGIIGESVPKFISARRQQFRTALIFLLLLGCFNGAYQVEKRFSGIVLDVPYTRLVVISAGLVGGWLLPDPVNRRGEITLGSGGAAVVVRSGCNGLEAIFLMVAGILAYPVSWRHRTVALIIYVPLLFLLNLLRVVMLLFVFANYPSYIDVFHYQIGQGILVVFVFVFWMHYVHWSTH
jgi:exosortase/archaeosortase family protein